jgi:hypothetical protein
VIRRTYDLRPIFGHATHQLQENVMSLSSSEQVTATQKASLDMSLGLLNTAFEGFRKLAKLNPQAFKSMLVEGQDAVHERLPANQCQTL